MFPSAVSFFLRASTPLKAYRGIYAGIKVGSGNQISHSERKTKRKWYPNTLTKTFYSELLNETFTIPITTSALRFIERYFGFDNFILFANEKVIQDSLFTQDLKPRLIESWKKKYQQPFNSFNGRVQILKDIKENNKRLTNYR